jgi:sugar phosphate isomerase/epimerase
MRIDRRGFLTSGAALAASSVLPSAAAASTAPAAPGVRLKLGLAAYSMRKYLDLKNPTMTLEEFIEKTAEWGCEGVELTEYYFKKPLTPEYLLKIKRACIKAGLPISGTPVGNTFTVPPGEVRDNNIALVKSWINVSADLGSPAIRIFAGNTGKGVDEDQARKWAIECIESVLPHAAKRGVCLALENHGGIVATADGLLEIVKAVKDEWFGVNLDTGNFHSADVYGDLERCAPYAITCQVKAAIVQSGKKEESDYSRIVALMHKANYHGYLTLEYEEAEEPLTAIPKQLDGIRKAIGQP